MGDMGNQDAIYPEFYPKVVSSTVFLAELLKDQVTCKRTKSKQMFMFTFVTNSRKLGGRNDAKGRGEKDSSDVDNFNINPTHISKNSKRSWTILVALLCVWSTKDGHDNRTC